MSLTLTLTLTLTKDFDDPFFEDFGPPSAVQHALCRLAELLVAVSAKACSQHLQKRGIPCFVLGVNDEATLVAAAKAGATAMLTDRPRWLKETDDTNELEWLRQVLDCCMHMCAGVLVCRCAQACPRVRRFER